MGMLFGFSQGRQFSRCGCASTPACGSEVRVFDPSFMAQLKLGPSGPCHSKVFAHNALEDTL